MAGFDRERDGDQAHGGGSRERPNPELTREEAHGRGGRDMGRDAARDVYGSGWGPETWSGGSSTAFGGAYMPERHPMRDRDRYERDREGAGLWDRVKRGLHAGKGPKGYRRSDERIHEDVCDLLERDADVDASDIAVAVRAGEVTLTGTVEDRWTKRRAEDVIDGVSGVKDVHNQLRVAAPGAPRPGEGLTAEMPAPDRNSPRGRSRVTKNR